MTVSPRGLVAGFPAEIELRIPGFIDTVPSNFVWQLGIEEREAAEWFSDFERRLKSARGYLPLYRMSDGEFIFMFGRHLTPLSLMRRQPLFVLKRYARKILGMDRGRFLAGTPSYGYETYDKEEWRVAKEGYAERLRGISEAGILALNLVRQADGFSVEYVGPACEWFEANNIHLTDQNYFPFYFVYALLLGPGARRLFAGKRVLVITSDDSGEKLQTIGKRLLSLGASEASGIRISRSKSMFDRIDVRGRSADIVLIGAGVGALNILEQVRPLEALSIDAGFVLDCYWMPEAFMGKRIFTMPDEGISTIDAKP